MLAMLCCTAVVDLQARQEFLESDPWDCSDPFESLNILVEDDDMGGGSFVLLHLAEPSQIRLFEHARHVELI
jgi:hypothetical protein